MFVKKTIVIQMMTAIAAMSMTAGAVAANINGLFTDINGNSPVAIPDAGDKITVNGNAYISKPKNQNVLWDLTKDLEITGDLGKATNCGSANVTISGISANPEVLLNVKGNVTVDIVTVSNNANLTVDSNLTLTTGEATLSLQGWQAPAIATVKGDVESKKITIDRGTLAVGGSIAADTLDIKAGKLEGLNGSVISDVTVKNFNTSVSTHVDSKYSDLTIDNLTVTESLKNEGGALTATGKFGTEANAINVTNASGTGGAITLAGDAYLEKVSLTKGDLTVNGTTTLSGSTIGGLNSTSSHFKTTKLNIDGNAYFVSVGVEADDIVINEKAGTLNSLVVAGTSEDGAAGLLKIKKSVILNGAVNFSNQNADEKLVIPTVVLNQSSEDNYFQSFSSMDIENVIVKKFGRLDERTHQEGGLTVKNALVDKDGVFTVTSKYADSTTVIDNLALGDGAKFNNGVWDKDGSDFKKGAHATVKQLTGSNVTVTNRDGELVIGSGEGSVKLEGQITDKNDGLTLNLGDKSFWNVTGESLVGNLALNGGLTNISETDANVSVSKLTGTSGTVLMDAAKKNTITVKDAAKDAKVEILATENADKVTTGQAEALVYRLVGVDNKSAFVDEGMYQGAITVDKAGHATQAKNDLMADTLELASASTLSLNRILMNDVRKRLGDIRSLEATNGVWARYDGGKLSGEGTTNKFNTLHIGGDMAPFADNSMRLGVSASYTKGDVDYTRGSSDLDAYSLAAYGTWMADNGLFADVIARVAKAKSDMKVDGVYKGDLNNTAYSLSGEMGWRFDFNDMFYAEPQMEATYTYIDSDKMTLSGNGEAYHYAVDSFDSLIGRVGVLAGMKCPAQKGDLYVRASMVHEFFGDATINGGNMAKIENDGKDTWVEYGVGANFNIMKNAYIWADIERTAGANVDEDWRGTVGVRYAF